MDNVHKIMSTVIVALVIVILLMHGCGKSINDGSESIVSIDTVTNVTVYDTTWYDTTTFKYITVETPKIRYIDKYVFDTIALPIYSANDFDQIMSHPSVYADSMIRDDTVHLSYRATVRGYLDKLEIGYKVIKPFLVESNTTIETEITKVKRPISFYMGLNAGTNKAGPTQFSPMAEIATPKMSYGLGYDILNQAVVLSVKARISFRKKPKIIPRP